MKEIFTDLYKKVVGFFQTQERDSAESKNVACNRLKLVLMQDRTNLTPFLLERMRSEMIDVLSKYVEMDREALELNFEQEGDSMALMLSIPVLRAKEEDEIQEIIKRDEEAKAKAKAEAEAETQEAENEAETSETSEDVIEEKIEIIEEVIEKENSEEKQEETLPEIEMVEEGEISKNTSKKNKK